MTRQDNPEYFDHICLVVEAVFAAENKLVRDGLGNKLKSGEITPMEYIEAVAEEMISRTDKSEIET